MTLSLQPITLLLKRLWHHFSPRRRGQFALLLVLMIFASFAEIFSIGAVLPFLGMFLDMLTAPNRFFAYPAAQPFIHVFGLTTPGQLLLPLTVLFGLTAKFTRKKLMRDSELMAHESTSPC